MSSYCRNLKELQAALENLYDEQWYANVPFDGGEALFSGDSTGYVSDSIDSDWFQDFFAKLGPEPEGKLIVAAPDLLAPGASLVVRLDTMEINDELIAYLAKHPEKMRDMPHRKFEELVAELFKSKGYTVTLTPRTRDGGFDVQAVQRSDIGTVLILIECKRYAPQNKVGVEVIRGLYGVVEHQSATKGLIATTSYFTKAAQEFHNDLKCRLALADFDAMRSMLNEWRAKKL